MTELSLYNKYVFSNPAVMQGKPCIINTRLSVEFILDSLSSGETVEQLLNEYPNLTIEGIQAALKFASKALSSDIIYPISSEVKS